MTKRWSLDDGSTLVCLGPSRTAVISTLESEFPEGPYRAFEEFEHRRGDEVLDRFSTTAGAAEEDMGATSHAVIGDELRSYFVMITFGAKVRTTREERVVLRGLKPLP